MSTHTPGEWVIGKWGTDIRDEQGYEIARAEDGAAIIDNWDERYPEFAHWASGPEGTTWIERSEEEAQANARLISAAPDLLSACRLALTRFSCQNGEVSEEVWIGNYSAVKALGDAVAKATGG